MKVLILSCNTGGGHNAAAQAIAEAIREHGECAEVLDYLSLAGKGVSKLVGDGYVKVVKKAPAMFGVAYKLGMVVSRLMKKSPVYYANARMARYLEKCGFKYHHTEENKPCALMGDGGNISLSVRIRR